ncbi:MAG: chemotaxis protein CheW [Deltaproteobacteria bacterium]|nr:chemotaxis protein CheW [Deltaproteobacteria bacterium]
MEKNGDRLVFSVNGRHLALPLASVERVVERPRVYFLPGGRPPLMGVITHMAEPVTVIDLDRLFGAKTGSAAPYTVVIARAGGKIVGLCAGAAGGKPSFLWSGDLRGAKPGPAAGKYISRAVELSGRIIEELDCSSLYDEISDLLSRPENMKGPAEGG